METESHYSAPYIMQNCNMPRLGAIGVRKAILNANLSESCANRADWTLCLG